MKRRKFLKTAGAVAAPTIVPVSVLGRGPEPAPSERISLGLVGAGGKGYDLWCGPSRKLPYHPDPDHRKNFVAGVKTRQECICPAEVGHRSVTPGHLAFVSDALKRLLKWDPKNEKVIGDPEAYKLLNKLDYRGDWAL